jgi:glycerol-3-phosphate O-acyltransferase
MSNPGRDVIFVPVQLGYDKVIETPSYVNELLGTPKEKESIFQLFSSLNVFQLKWGRIDVRFGGILLSIIDKTLTLSLSCSSIFFEGLYSIC